MSDFEYIKNDVEYVLYSEERNVLITYTFELNEAFGIHILVFDNGSDTVLFFETFKARYDGCYYLGVL